VNAAAAASLAHRVALAVAGWLAGAAPALCQTAFMSADEARPVVTALRATLPPGLAAIPDDRLASAWRAWVRERDRAVRERLALGEQDAVVNLLYFGTSFTAAPRLSAAGLALLGQQGAEAVLARRIDDLMAALAKPGSDERLAVARAALGLAGPPRPADRPLAERRLLEAVARVQREQAALAAELAKARAMPDATSQLAARSTLFRERGIALDTSLRPVFAIEEALREALGRGLLARGAVRRVAVVGPGLDFVDKAEGQDFYPPQSLQSLALADSLLRLGLADARALEMTAFDISPRVLDHLRRAGERAAAGQGYVIQLPRPADGWGAGLVEYWGRFGDALDAQPAPAVAPPEAAGPVVVRAVRVPGAVAGRIRPVDLNVVYQRLELPAGGRFDLVVATNILVYYDTFEQCLALANIARMTAVGGLLLANNAVLELSGSALRSAGYKTVVFSDRPDDGEHVIFYRRIPNPSGHEGPP
jgi:hypothetical protein